MKKIISAVILFFIFSTQIFAFENYFIFGLRLQENDYDIAKRIEDEFKVKIPVISLIYDDFEKWEALKLYSTFKTLGNDRVYHISINPFWHNLKDLITHKTHMWWEKKYRNLFKIIKKTNSKVIFRFLHEMNWGWYSRASDPYNFPTFWKMVWNWSREEWLDRSNILFDFSINSQDLPAIPWAVIGQSTPVITCNQEMKAKTWCFTFENYYPGDEFVDLLGITIYNWWDWARMDDWAHWRSPLWVINEPGYWTLDRMKKFNKPIFVDEAWSTSIKESSFDNNRNIASYKQNHSWIPWNIAVWTKAKNDWIWELKNLYIDPQILGWAYFNADVTYGFTDRSKVWELDWTAIDPDKYFAYPNIIKLLNDPKMLRDPTLYFDLSDKELASKDWITNDEMYSLYDLVSKYIVFQEWNILTEQKYSDPLKFAKYQKYLEKKISADPVFCGFVSSKFSKIKCAPNKDFSWLNDKKKVFELLKKKIDTSVIKLSNWGIWEQTEIIKKSLLVKYKTPNITLTQKQSIKNMYEYLNYYEKNYLDLR